MELLWLFVAGLIALVLGLVAGLYIGERLRERRPWTRRLAYGAAFADGVLLAFLGAYFDQPWLWAVGMGWMTGALTGLKYGIGRSVGLWRAIDAVTGSDELPREKL